MITISDWQKLQKLRYVELFNTFLLYFSFNYFMTMPWWEHLLFKNNQLSFTLGSHNMYNNKINCVTLLSIAFYKVKLNILNMIKVFCAQFIWIAQPITDIYVILFSIIFRSQLSINKSYLTKETKIINKLMPDLINFVKS